VTTISPARF